MGMNDLENLLSEVQKCVIRDKQIKEEQFQRGERFNVFSILNLRTNETRTHSAFLAELLNPHGSHGCGAELLKNFLEKCGLTAFSEEDLLNAEVTVEHSIGRVDYDKNEGGRLDILIHVADLLVVIENKINAGDQPGQIQRYYNYGRARAGSKSKIIYLTLDGHDASEYSRGSELKVGEHYFLMSYKDDILDFIQKSTLATIQRPLVRGTLIQYANLIKELTNQDMNSQQEQEMFEAMAKHPEAVVQMFETGSEKYVQWVHEKYVRPKFEQFAKENGLEYEEADYLWSDAETGFWFYKPDWKTFAIFIWKEGGPTQKYYSGVSNRQGESLQNLEKEENLLPMYEEQNKYWPLGWGFIDEKFCKGDASIVPAMINGEFVEYIEKLIQDILKQIEDKGIELP